MYLLHFFYKFDRVLPLYPTQSMWGNTYNMHVLFILQMVVKYMSGSNLSLSDVINDKRSKLIVFGFRENTETTLLLLLRLTLHNNILNTKKI